MDEDILKKLGAVVIKLDPRDESNKDYWGYTAAQLREQTGECIKQMLIHDEKTATVGVLFPELNQEQRFRVLALIHAYLIMNGRTD